MRNTFEKNIFERATISSCENESANGRKEKEEYCWAITRAAGRSPCGRSGYSVLVFRFQRKSLVYTYRVDNICTQFRLEKKKIDLRRTFRSEQLTKSWSVCIS